MTTFDRRERVRVMDTFRNLFYAPIYVAVAGGFFYRHGLDVMFGTVPSDRSSFDMLSSGEVDFVQTGISRTLMALDDGHDDVPLHVAEINQRDGFFLVSKQPVSDWKWGDLEGASVIPVGFTPVPWTSLRASMVKHGVDLSKVKLIGGLSAEDAISRFRNGEADYLHMVNPQAQQLVEEGVGHFAAAIGPELPYICYSSFAATPTLVQSKPDVVQAFVNGFYDAQKWVSENNAAAIAERVSSFLPGFSTETIVRSVERYKDQGTWATDPAIGVDGYEAMRQVLIEGGVVNAPHAYDLVVRPEFAQAAIG